MGADDHGRVSYLEAGSGTPLVLIPGLEGDRGFFMFQIEGLSPRARVISVDLPTLSPSPWRTVHDYALEILKLLDVLSVKRAVFFAVSMGGMVAMDIPITHPERVLGLVLCNCICDRRITSFGLNRFTLATAVHFITFLPVGERARKRILIWVGKNRGFIFDPSPGNKELVDYLARRRGRLKARYVIDRLLAVAKSDIKGRISEISCPVLIVRGGEDHFVPESVALFLKDAIEDADLRVVKGGGHACPLTVPRETNAAVLDWLDVLGL